MDVTQVMHFMIGWLQDVMSDEEMKRELSDKRVERAAVQESYQWQE